MFFEKALPVNIGNPGGTQWAGENFKRKQFVSRILIIIIHFAYKANNCAIF